MPRFAIALVLLVVSAAFLSPATNAAAVRVTITTPSLAGLDAILAFDFVDGGSPTNSIALRNFVTDGILGSMTSSGGVTGTLPGDVLFDDSAFLNELLAELRLGSTLAFDIDVTGSGPNPGSFPDAFSVFLLDQSTLLPLFSTLDPTGADSLLQIDLIGPMTQNVRAFGATDGSVSVTHLPIQSINEPGTMWLVLFPAMLTLLFPRAGRFSSLRPLPRS